MFRSLRARLRRDRPLRIAVRDAWLDHERYAGQAVEVFGVVRAFEVGTPGAYFTLDDGADRVGLRADAARLRPLVGRRVRAVGTLTFRPGVGIFLDAQTLDEVTGTDSSLRSE